jgi:hypothetical protein
MEIPAHEATLIQGMALLSLLSATYGTLLGHFYVCFFTYAIGLTTLLYWSNPVMGWRRTVDMSTVGCGLIVHLIVAGLWSRTRWLYYAITAAALACYPVSNWLHDNGHVSAGIAVHALLHVLANVGNFVMYYGISST